MFKNKIYFIGLIALAINFISVSCFRESSSVDSNFSSHSSNRILRKDNFNLHSVDDLQSLFTFEENRYPLVSAHRGRSSKDYPENSLESFQLLANEFPVIIECDVRMSKDSVLVLMHDATLNRTTTGSGNVNYYSLKKLKELHLLDKEGNETKFKIPTLEEVLLWGKGKVIFTLDIKNDVPYKLVSDVIERASAKPYTIVITNNAKQARNLYNVNPDLVISASIKNEKDLRLHTQIGIPDTKLIAFVGSSQPNQELVDLLHLHGIKVIMSSVGNLDKRVKTRGYQVYADYVEKGADIISTDYPLDAKKAFDFYIKKRKLSSPYIN